MSTNTKADGLSAFPDGRLKLVLDGKPYTLRKPVIGEQWKFDEALAGVRQLEADDAEWAIAELSKAADVDADDLDRLKPVEALRAARGINPLEATQRTHARHRALLGWWCEVFGMLGDVPETPIEELPVFLVDAKTIALAQEAWARNPQAPGDD